MSREDSLERANMAHKAIAHVLDKLTTIEAFAVLTGLTHEVWRVRDNGEVQPIEEFAETFREALLSRHERVENGDYDES